MTIAIKEESPADLTVNSTDDKFISYYIVLYRIDNDEWMRMTHLVNLQERSKHILLVIMSWTCHSYFMV
jgi:hypothetical protein